MNIVAAVDRNWAIGYKNSLFVRIPRDQKTFREMTEGKVIVVGRKTLESFPQKQPLKNRINIILSKDRNYTVKDAIVVHSINELMKVLEQFDSNDVYIAGGESIYEQLLPYCDTAYITKIDYAYQADAFLSNLDSLPEWELSEESEEQTYFDLAYYFLKYIKKG